MQEDIFPDKLKNKLYSDNAIRVATFLGGPLVAGYLIAENYKQLGEADKIKLTWLYSVLATIVVFVIAFLLPDSTPAPLLPIGYTVAAYYLVQKLQGAKIKAHIAGGGQMWPMWRAIVAGIIGLVIIVAIFFAIYLFIDQYYSA